MHLQFYNPISNKFHKNIFRGKNAFAACFYSYVDSQSVVVHQPRNGKKLNSSCFGHTSSLLFYMLTQWEIHDVLLEASSENKPEEGTMHPGIHDGMTFSLPFPPSFP